MWGIFRAPFAIQFPAVRATSSREAGMVVFGRRGHGSKCRFFLFPLITPFSRKYMSCACVVLPNLSISSDRQGIRFFPVDMYYNPTSRIVRYIFPSIIEARSGSPRVCMGLTDLRPSVFTTRITYCSPLSHVNVYSEQECVYLRGCEIFRHT